MRRKITGLLLVSILAATTVCGCGRGAGSDGTTVSVQENVSDLAGEEETSDSGCYLSFGDVPKEEFVVKLEEAGIPEDTLLVGVNTVYDENAMVQLNHMLKEQGYGFDVVFCRLPDQCCWNETISDFAEYLREQEVSMDILPVWKGALPSLADQGLLTDLSSDLEEEGTLRASYPEKFWELTAVDGRNYGPGLWFVPPDGWAVNQELMEKYGFTGEDLAKDITELEDVLRTVSSGEDRDGFAAFVYNPRFFLESIPFSYIDTSLPAGYWLENGSGEIQVVNLFDTEEMYDLVETMNRYYEAGYVQIGGDMESLQSFFLQPDFNGSPIRRSDGLDTWTNTSGAALLRIPYYQKTEDQLMYEICTIPSWSEKKEEAWEFLTFINENEEASNLLLYGIEGEDYEISGDSVLAGEDLTETDIFYRCLGNLLTASPLVPYEDSQKAELLEEELESLQESPLKGFVFDEEPVRQEAEAVRALYNELTYFEEMFAFEKSGEYGTWQEYYSAYSQMLKDAGIDRIVEEMNRQIQEYLGNENQD